MKTALRWAVAGLLVAACAKAAAAPEFPYQDTSRGVDDRVADLLSRMSLEAKASLVSGGGWEDTRAHPRLGIPALKTGDGAPGVRGWMGRCA